MTALQSIAVGLLLVFVDVNVTDWDVIPDVLGWGLVLIGVAGLRPVMPVGGLFAAAVVAGLVSVALLDRSFATSLPDSTGWMLSLPEVAFNFLLANGLAAVLKDDLPDLARRYRAFRWIFLGLAVAPVLVLGGGGEALVVPLALFAVGAYAFYIVTLLKTASALRPVRAEPGTPPGIERC